MILAIVVVIAIVMLVSNHHTLEGSLQMQGIERQPELARDKIRQLRALASESRVAQIAIANLATQNISPGFLSNPEALAALSTPPASHEASGGRLVFSRATSDVAGDTPAT